MFCNSKVQLLYTDQHKCYLQALEFNQLKDIDVNLGIAGDEEDSSDVSEWGVDDLNQEGIEMEA